MVLLWVVVGLVSAIFVTNISWFATPIILAIVGRNVEIEDFISGNSVPHSATNFLVGIAAGAMSLYAAMSLLDWAQVESSWPLWVISIFMLISALQNLRIKVTPYSHLAAKGQLVGLVMGMFYLIALK
jgi:hypothetical protein